MELKLKQRKTSSNKQKVLFCIVALVLLFVGIGYAYVRTVLKVGGDITFAEEIKNKRVVNILGQQMVAYMDNVKSPYVTSASGINFDQNSSSTNGQGLYMRTGTENDEYPIIYYRGGLDSDGDGVEDTLNNNVLFANYCWKIVRTTETGGIKLLYNGSPRTEVPTAPIDESEYINITNDATYPYLYDSSTKKWKSDMKGTHNAVGIFQFSIGTAGEYYFDYAVSSETNHDKVTVEVNETKIIDAVSGEIVDKIKMNLSPSDIVRVTYAKDNSLSSWNDNVVFSIESSTGEVETETTCRNMGLRSQIGNSNYYGNSNSPAYVGYMRGVQEVTSGNIASTKKYEYHQMTYNSNYIYGQSVSYEDGIYTLKNTTIGYKEGYKYTCLSDTNVTCNSVAFQHYGSDSGSVYYLLLEGAKNIEEAKNEMFSNKYDSNVKKVVDDWYKKNIDDKNYNDRLEDTVWCNERDIKSGGLLSELSSTGLTVFDSNSNNKLDINLCPKNDRFTLKSTNANYNPSLDGNQMLDYPVGLITIKEAQLGGLQDTGYIYSSTTYLNTRLNYWTLSPANFFGDCAQSNVVGSSGYLCGYGVKYNYGVRPSVSLKKGIVAIRGTGAINNPYVITE